MRRVLKSTLTAASTAIWVVALALVMSSQALANPICADLFRDHTETDKKAAVIRKRLHDVAYGVLTESLAERLQLVKEYRNYLRVRQSITPAVIEKAIQSSPTLQKLDLHAETRAIKGGSMLPPAISPATQQAMLLESMPTAQLSRILNEDPYFIWLKHNAYATKTTDSETIRFRGALIRTDKEQIDPVTVYLNARADGYRDEVALMVLQRAMDPLIPADMLRLIDRVVYHDELMRTLETKVMPWLESGKKTHGYDNADVEAAWRRFPSLGAARENLRAVLDAQVEMYGQLFSRSSYERVLYMAVGEKHADPLLSVIAEYSELRARGQDDAAVARGLGARLDELRVRVGASKDLSTTELYVVVDRILKLVAAEKIYYKKLSYEYLLADVFAERHEESQLVTGRAPRNPTSREIQALRKLIELYEKLETKKSTVDYLIKLSDRRTNPY